MDFIIGLLLQLVIELLAELGIRGTAQIFQLEKPLNGFVSLMGYIFLAIICAGISIRFFDHHLIVSKPFQILNLCLSPILIGYVMSVRGKILIAHDKKIIRLDTFWYGFSFAFVFAIIRFIYAN